MKPLKPTRTVIYGIEGVGKSEFGAQAPNAGFISPEGGCDELSGGQEIPGIKKFDDVCGTVKALIVAPKRFDTLVLDSADWIEKLCHAKIIGDSGKSITTVNGGYGAGYRQAEQMHRSLIEDLSTLREKHGMNIIVTAHYQVKDVKDPEAVHDYQQFEIKCHELVSALWREWCDALLFCRFETFVKGGNDDSKTIARGTGNRVMYTEKRPAFQAKNRYGLPPELPMPKGESWKTFHEARLAARTEKKDDSPILFTEANDLCNRLGDDELKKKVATSIVEATGNSAQLRIVIARLHQILGVAA